MLKRSIPTCFKQLIGKFLVDRRQTLRTILCFHCIAGLVKTKVFANSIPGNDGFHWIDHFASVAIKICCCCCCCSLEESIENLEKFKWVLIPFWFSVSAALLRQATYGTIKIGIYQRIKRVFAEDIRGSYSPRTPLGQEKQRCAFFRGEALRQCVEWNVLRGVGQCDS